MRYPESVEYLYALANEIRSLKFGLESIRECLNLLGNPQTRFRSVHVAGTNGKGSTCAMIEAGARSAGLRTGLFTSPHLIEPTERIRINGVAVTHDQFAALFARVHEAGKQMETHPTYFETVTAMGFLHFADANLDLAVIEVGLGGRLDATNVVVPAVSAITPVDFDHEIYLGSSLEQIAREKAGIIKPNIPVVVAPQRPEAETVIAGIAPNAHFIRPDEFEDVRVSAYHSEFTFRGDRIHCPLAGAHQVTNAATAAAVLKRLKIPASGIANALWPGRLEKVSSKPDIILDGAHNPAGARALAAYIREFFSNCRIKMIYGAMRDKSVQEITEILFPLADQVIVTAPDSARALRPEALVEASDHPSIRTADRLSKALELACSVDPNDVIFITGSLYLVGEARALLVK